MGVIGWVMILRLSFENGSVSGSGSGSECKLDVSGWVMTLRVYADCASACVVLCVSNRERKR